MNEGKVHSSTKRNALEGLNAPKIENEKNQRIENKKTRRAII